MQTIEATLVEHDFFLRRRDLLALGYCDEDIKAELAQGRIFRVRHGWYSVPSAPEPAVRAVRVGGRLTGRSALASYGVPVPRKARIDVVVAAGACRLRNPRDRRKRVSRTHDVDIHWTEESWMKHRSSPWRVSIGEALAAVLRYESRDIAVACCDLVINKKKLSATEVERLFDRAPGRARRWRGLVDGRSDSHGETFVRLWLGDEGIRFEPQPVLPGVGRIDGRITPWTFLEVDGAQHDELSEWNTAGGPKPSQFEEDHRRGTMVAIGGGRLQRVSYLQLFASWDLCLAAVLRAVADDKQRVADERDAARFRRRRKGRRASVL